MNITFSQRMISPDDAKLLLSKNTGNRKLNQKNVNFLHKQMAKGNWLMTSDTIKIGKSGRLLDGQHRLAAIVQLGKPVSMVIAENLDDKIFEVLDTGKNRSAGDVLSIKGYKNVNNIAGACRFIMLFRRGNYSASGVNRDSKVTNSEILAFADKTPELHEILAYTSNIYRQFRPLSLTVLTGLYFILAEKNQTQADVFFEKYATGIDLSDTNPIRHLRERFIKDSQNKTKLNQRDKVALFIYAWNAFIQKKKMQQLTLQRNYVFPKPL